MPILVQADVVNPPDPTTATSPDGVLLAIVDLEHAGVLLEANYSGANPWPYQVDIFRGDGTPVRSGQPAWAVGGRALAYDAEVPLGETTSWYAVPRRFPNTLGVASQLVALNIPDIDGSVDLPYDHPDAYDCWLKPVNAPHLAMRLPLVAADSTFGESPVADLTYAPGSRYPTASYNRRTEDAYDFTVYTGTKSRRLALQQLLDLGPCYLQPRAALGMGGAYVLPLASKAAWANEIPTAARLVTVTFQPIAYPPALDAPLVIPGRSYADQLALAPDYLTRRTRWLTYGDAAGLP